MAGWPVLFVVATGVVVAAVAFVTTATAARILLADGTATVPGAGCPASGAASAPPCVSWTTAGENIGEGGPVPGPQTAIAQMAVMLTNGMLGEQPPNDGHRKNLLSSAFHHIGIAVFRSTSGTVWMTQDFSN
jgi:hypothetical protein